MRKALYVGLGSALGGLVRYSAAVGAVGFAGPGAVFGTLAVNVGGSLLIGVLSGLALAGRGVFPRPETQALWATGFCGGMTTYSLFSYETLLLLQSGRPGTGVLYVLASTVLALGAVWAGHALTARAR